jgi:hypothetical protein
MRDSLKGALLMFAIVDAGAVMSALPPKAKADID